MNYQTIIRKLHLRRACPAIQWRLQRGGDGPLDPPIVPLLVKLNQLPFLHTVSSCAGHTITEIRRSHEGPQHNVGWGVEVPYRITLGLHVASARVPRFIELVRSFRRASGEGFWCELGYHEMRGSPDLNMQVEPGYVHFEIQVFCQEKMKRDRCLRRFEAIVDEARQA